jgi:predicted RNA-binding Zn-ribbon protein involved in translation (DUF1610 family)
MVGMSKEYNTKYYQANKERILKGMLEKVMCPECNKMITRCNLMKHQRSKTHQNKAYQEHTNEIKILQDRINELEKRLVIVKD